MGSGYDEGVEGGLTGGGKGRGEERGGAGVGYWGFDKCAFTCARHEGS